MNNNSDNSGPSSDTRAQSTKAHRGTNLAGGDKNPKVGEVELFISGTGCAFQEEVSMSFNYSLSSRSPS